METKYKSLYQYFNQIYSIDETDFEILIPCFQKIKRKKLDFLVRESEVSRYLYFVESGLVRAFYFHEEKEITTWFTFENDIAGIFESAVERNPSKESLQVMLDSELTKIDYHAFKEYSLRSETLTKLLIRLFENAYMRMENRVTFIQHSSAKVRLKELILNEPHILRDVPHFYVASYLAISPETLSRLVKQVFKNA